MAEAAEMAQWLRVLAAPPEVLSSVSRMNSHGGLQPSITAVPQDLAPPSGIQTLTHEVHIHICTQAQHVYMKIKTNNKRKGRLLHWNGW
jgi:hypothetical protein